MTARRMFSIAMMVVMAAAGTAGCSDATGPGAAPDANGSWAGSITHPAYDGGSLSLMLTDANGAVEGTYRMRLTKVYGSRVQVRQISGRASGSSSGGRLTLRLVQPDGDVWLLEGRLEEGHSDGDWSTQQRVRGTFEISR